MLPELDTYGLNKRFKFVCKCIYKARPNRILDYGCGAGTYLTVPLANKFSDISFIGADSDDFSINYANKKYQHIQNLNFEVTDQLLKSSKYEMIIASEVLEHVEDPVKFLNVLRKMLTHNGYIVLTVPNGYGPFEWASLLESILYLSGILKVINFIKHKNNTVRSKESDTLANSPHINFFSYNMINELFNGVGMNVIEFKPRTFLCGFGFDKLIKSKKLLQWNENFSEKISPYIVSDWMFLLNLINSEDTYSIKRGIYSKIRKTLNIKRARL